MSALSWACTAGCALLLAAALAGAPDSTALARDPIALAGAPDHIPWLSDEAQARAESRRSGKPLLIDLQADWCGACKMLEADTWSDPEVRRQAARFVPLRLDLSAQDEATRAVSERYQVASLPVVIAGERRASGFMGPKEMLALMRK